MSKEKKYKIILDDFEHRVVVKALNEKRNELLANNKDTHILDDVIVKILKEKGKELSR